MKYIYLLLICFVCSCQNKGRLIKGELTDTTNVATVYLSVVTNERYNRSRVIDSAKVIENKFLMKIDTLKSGLYMLVYNNKSGKFFVSGENTLNVHLCPENDYNCKIDVEGSPLHKEYINNLKELYRLKQGKLLDSLDVLFMLAKKNNDKEEMKRVKTLSAPYYDKAKEVEHEYINNQMEANRGNDFGLYLFYMNRFVNYSFPSLADIEKVRTYIYTFGAYTNTNLYKERIEKKLALMENCAIGSVAPEFFGTDTLGNIVHLSDFRGKFVIIDFWSSGCRWCRLETPWLLEAQNYFKEKDFAILGVSADFKRENWIKAIHQDKSYWNQILQPKDSKIYEMYNINGIPHTILIDPNGVILAKDFRQNEIIPTVSKYINQR